MRRSPALLVAVLALVAALAGTALAGSDVQTSAVGKKKVKKIARKQIKKLAPSLSVANAETASRASSAGSADTATSANPIAFARVDASGADVVESDSKRIGDANVFDPGSDGIFCFRNLGFQFKGAEVTLEGVTGGGGPVAPAFADSRTSGALDDCGGPTQAQAVVYTVNGNDNPTAPLGFFIVFYN